MKTQLYAFIIAALSFSYAFGLLESDRAELARKEARIKGMENEVARLQNEIAKSEEEAAIFKSASHCRYAEAQSQRAVAQSTQQSEE